jgi:hypothetical protein
MSLFRKLLLLLPSRRRQQEQDMQDELQSIRDMAGPAELGNLTLAAENARSVWTWAWMEDIRRDVQSSLRMLRRYPAVTLIALMSLALGIGANTMVFSFLNELVFRPFRFPDPERLVKFSVSVSPSECLEIPDSRVFEDSGCYADNVSACWFQLCQPGAFDRLSLHVGSAARVGSPSGSGPLVFRGGRSPGSAACLLISYGLWQRRFGADPDILGKTVRMDGDIATIIGVTPRDFEFGNPNVSRELYTGLARLENQPDDRAPAQLGPL